MCPSPEYYSDDAEKMGAIKKQVGTALKNVLGLTVEVQLVEPMGITRSEGKAVRVIDNRALS